MNRGSITAKIWLSIGIFVLGFLVSTAQVQRQGIERENSLEAMADAYFPAAQSAQSAEGAFINALQDFGDAIVIEDQSIVIDTWLSDAPTDRQIWRDKVREPLDALHEAEREIFARVVNTVAPHVRDVEIERAQCKEPVLLSAYDCVLRAMWAMATVDLRSFTKAGEYLDRAMALDAKYAVPHALKGRWHSIRVGQSWAEDREAEIAAAFRHAELAMRLAPQNSLALATAGHIKSYLMQDFRGGLDLLNRSIDACCGDPNAWSLSSATLSYLGEGVEARARAEHAIRLSPFDPALYSYCFFAGLACYVEGDYSAAVSHLRRSLAENPDYSSTYKALCASYVGLGEISAARTVANSSGDAVNRRPAAGEFRSNLAVGGQPEACDLSDAERAICAELAPALRAEGLFFVGIDVIDGRLSEINVTSPTGVREVERLGRSEERRVGKECRSRWSPYH